MEWKLGLYRGYLCSIFLGGILWYPVQGPSESSARVVATSGQMGKAADPATLLAAASRAACLAKAPRRTVQGVAAAVAAVVMQASAAPLATDTGEPVKIPDAIGGISEDELALRLRLARAARRKAKRQRRRAAKAAAAMDVDTDDPQQVETIDDSQWVETSGVASGGDTDPPPALLVMLGALCLTLLGQLCHGMVLTTSLTGVVRRMTL